jgi:GxxExxY protein
MLEKETTSHVIGAFFTVYNKLGFGFLESVYAEALERELVKRGRTVQREVHLTVWYDGRELANQRVDMIVDGTVLVESKSSAVLPAFAKRQVLNYLRGTSLQVGLLPPFRSRSALLPDGPYAKGSVGHVLIIRVSRQFPR